MKTVTVLAMLAGAVIPAAAQVVCTTFTISGITITRCDAPPPPMTCTWRTFMWDGVKQTVCD
jgi:hypothetical protein